MKNLLIVPVVVLVLTAAQIYGQDAITIISNGNVGIGTDTPSEKLEVNGRISDKSGLVAPVGIVMFWTNSTAPSGWLVCDGSAVSRTTYADLFAVVGTTFGEGDGSTTFNLPSLTTPEKFIRCDTTPDPVGGGSDDAVVVKHKHNQDSHSHNFTVGWARSGPWPSAASGNRSFGWIGSTDSRRPEIHETGVDGTDMNMPAYVELVPVIKY